MDWASAEELLRTFEATNLRKRRCFTNAEIERSSFPSFPFLLDVVVSISFSIDLLVASQQKQVTGQVKDWSRKTASRGLLNTQLIAVLEAGGVPKHLGLSTDLDVLSTLVRVVFFSAFL